MSCNWFLKNAKHLIQIEGVSEVVDDYGGQSQTWAEDSTRYAVVEPVTGSNPYRGEVLEPEVTHKFTIRYDDNYYKNEDLHNYRILFDDKLFRLLYVKNWDDSRKFYGHVYQTIYATNNGPLNE